MECKSAGGGRGAAENEGHLLVSLYGFWRISAREYEANPLSPSLSPFSGERENEARWGNLTLSFSGTLSEVQSPRSDGTYATNGRNDNHSLRVEGLKG